MRSVADTLRQDDQRATAALPVAERMGLSLELGGKTLEIYMAYQEVDRRTALEHFRAQAQAGRRRCGCLQDNLN